MGPLLIGGRPGAQAMTRPLLDFDEALAQDDHPAKGVTVGDIRAWFDEIERLQRRINTLERLLGEANIAVPDGNEP
jgi:hypothetical protein